MTWFEITQIVLNSVPLLLALLAGYVALKRKVNELIKAVHDNTATSAALKDEVRILVEYRHEQSKQIDVINKDIATIKDDVVVIKGDLRTIWENLQDAAHGNPQKGELERLDTDKPKG